MSGIPLIDVLDAALFLDAFCLVKPDASGSFLQDVSDALCPFLNFLNREKWDAERDESGDLTFIFYTMDKMSDKWVWYEWL